jgi:hypothetical protein
MKPFLRVNPARPMGDASAAPPELSTSVKQKSQRHPKVALAFLAGLRAD